MTIRAAIYARYSSENQRPESIDDQISSCRRLAATKGYEIDDRHIYRDQVASGARSDRGGLSALRAAAEQKLFTVVLVDDLSRLARNTLLMLSIIEELRFHGIRVVSVADGLDTDDEESTVGIQVRGIFNELQLSDLRKKTFRGQLGQKQRGFIVGESTYGYRSVPVGEVRTDKKGRPRPEGYRMEVDAEEAKVVLRIFREFAAGRSESAIMKTLNEEQVPGRARKQGGGWSPSTLNRILRNEKYVARWCWNKTSSRRDPRSGRRRQFVKPESEWVVTEDERLRIVPESLWAEVKKRLAGIKKTWPRPKGTQGFQPGQGSRVVHYPKELLSGAMTCGLCGGSVTKVSGKGNGYYGCLAASRGGCENRVLVRRTLAEKVVLSALRERIGDSAKIRYIFEQVKEGLRKNAETTPADILEKQNELVKEERRIGNFVASVGDGRASKALLDALALAEGKAEQLRFDLALLQKGKEISFSVPPVAWIEDRVARISEILAGRTPSAALLLRKFFGPIRLKPEQTKEGRRYLKAETKIQALALLEFREESAGSDAGSYEQEWWRRRESNPRPGND